MKLGDARKLPIKSNTIDLVLTSPPYLNAIDYIRCSKFSLVWMGYGVDELRELRSTSVGSEVGECEADSDVAKIIDDLNLSPRLKQRDHSILARYVEDMKKALAEVERVLVPKGKAIYVIGENTIKGTYIQNSKIVSAVANLVGLKLKERRSRVLPQNRRYLPPPEMRASNNLDARMRREVLLTFQK